MKKIILMIVMAAITSCSNDSPHNEKGLRYGDCVGAFAEWGVNAASVDSIHIGEPYSVYVQYYNGRPDGLHVGVTRGLGSESGSIIQIDRNSGHIALVHEIGHVLGFWHSPDSKDVMFFEAPMPNQRTHPTFEQMLAAMVLYEGKTFKCAVIE